MMGLYLAFDGGGSTTRAGLYDAQRNLVAESDAGASNPIDVGVDACVGMLTGLARALLQGRPERPATVAAGIAGAGSPVLRDEIAKRLATELRAEHTLVTNDLLPLLAANARGQAAILAIAGTGSSVLAQAPDGRIALLGARGPLFGDEGSAHHIAVNALRAAAATLDGMGPRTRLTEALPEAAQLSSFAEFPVWARAATKCDVAVLAKAVTRLADEGDAVAAHCVKDQAARLAAQVAAARARLALLPETTVYVHGGLFERCRRYHDDFARALKALQPRMNPSLPPLRGHRAVVELAWIDLLPSAVSVCPRSSVSTEALPSTELRSSHATPLDRLPARGIVARMNEEDARVVPAVAREADRIAQAVEAAADALQSGGRLIYVGAGTSGRLGVLDASECPPTFGVSPDRVIGIIAGGERALRESIEGAEDDVDQAVADLCARTPPLGPSDFVVGIAASGATPYTRAALVAARERGARTALVCCAPVNRDAADIVIVVECGPEALAGSTRLKAGTAAKLALNMISTGAMALSGRIYNGRMTGMRPSNAKLRRRAIRIITAITGADDTRAAELLARADNSIAAAIIMARLSVDAEAARKRLAETGGNLRRALEDVS